MSESKKVLSAEQAAIVKEFGDLYGIEPEEILFFEGSKRPFFTYEATCALVNLITDVQNIEIEMYEAGFEDAIAIKCSLTLPNGKHRSAVGVVNINETIDGLKMNDQQLFQLASARAIRNALRTAGIDLLRCHNENNGNTLDFKPKSNFAALLGMCHALGKEAGLIVGDDKTAWRTILQNRYGVSRSNELTDEQLSDFQAVLQSLAPKAKSAFSGTR